MANMWFTSDSHFSHENIIQFQGRPFTDAREMDETLVARWNQCVMPSDHIYHLGDVTMLRGSGAHRIESLLTRLNGHKRLVLGNHDACPAQWYLKFFEKVKAINVLDNIIFTHIPIHACSIGRFVANVHGHIHGNASPMPVQRIHPTTQQVTLVPYINVCVEVTNYRPLAFEEVKQRIRLLAEGTCAPADIEHAVHQG